MRDTLILHTAKTDATEVQRRLFALTETTGDAHFRYFTQDECVYGVSDSRDILSDYDDEELSEIRSRVGEFEPLQIEYQNAECVRGLLLQLLPGMTGVLDTNYDDVLDYNLVLQQIEANPDWSPASRPRQPEDGP
jgi:hypothetical protein